MRPRINRSHVGSSVYNSEVRINQRAYKRTLNYENMESSNRIVDILDEETFKKFESMKGIVWQHTMLGHTIQISSVEASRLFRSGIKGVTVKIYQ